MKKLLVILLLCSIVISCITGCVSFPVEKPQSGFWYCQELRTGIDFDLYQTTRYCILIYNDDGSVQVNACHFDYGTGVHFCVDRNGSHQGYFYGQFKYYKKKKQFVITDNSDGHKYVFTRQDRITANISMP